MKLVTALQPTTVLTEMIGGGFFGYFDKSPWNPARDRDQILLHRTALLDRMPQPGETIELALLEMAENAARPIATSTAWNFQQGAMLQWLPGSPDTIVYNDLHKTRPIGRRLNIVTGQSDELTHPFAAISPTGGEALSLNFGRLTNIKPEYGYAGAVDPFAGDTCPDGDGLWRLDLGTGEAELLISTRQVAACAAEPGADACVHYLNHALYNRDGTSFCFLHRFINPAGTQRTRLMVCDSDGGNLRVGISGMASHFGWRNTTELLAWAGERRMLDSTNSGLIAKLPVGRILKGLYRALGKPASLKAGLLNDRYVLFDFAADTRTTIAAGVLTTDGHCSFRADGDWFVTDTYPDAQGRAKLVVASLKTDTAYVVGEFQFPARLDNEVRCDLHPRWHPVKPLVAIDLVVNGRRQLAYVDVSDIV